MDINKLMTPERVVGAVIWSLAHNELPNDLIWLVRDVLDQDTVRKMHLEGDLSTALAMIRGANIDPIHRQGLIDMIWAEIDNTIKAMEKDHHR